MDTECTAAQFREWLGAAAAGDRDAFGEIVDLLLKDAYRFAARLAGCKQQDAEDVVHDAFLRLWNNLPTLAAKNSALAGVRAYLRKSIRSVSCDNARRAVRRKTSNFPEDCEPSGDKRIEQRSDGIAEMPATVANLRKAIARLPAYQREVMELVFAGLGLREIAEELNIPSGTVSSRKSRGLITLRALLAEE